MIERDGGRLLRPWQRMHPGIHQHRGRPGVRPRGRESSLEVSWVRVRVRIRVRVRVRARVRVRVGAVESGLSGLRGHLRLLLGLVLCLLLDLVLCLLAP